ncbi:MAG: DNA repair protein RecN [Pseudomonadota bacterium]
MLLSLAIRDVVLIDAIELDFGSGLTVLTGETGAGKSIILDALGLALGRRADQGMVRPGARQGSITAIFEGLSDHPVRDMLKEHELPDDEALILRRTLNAEGRTRCFVNDHAVGINLLKEIGEALIEVHGQHDQRGLLDANRHLHLLDAFAGHEADVAALRRLYQHWKDAQKTLDVLAAELTAIRQEEAYLQARFQELNDLSVNPGEEVELAARRALLQQGEKLGELLQDAQATIAGSDGIVGRLGGLQRRFERVPEAVQSTLDPILQALERLVIEAGEVEASIDAVARSMELDPGALERLEDRLFALRDAARKHRVAVDELPALLDKTRQELDAINTGADAVELARKTVRETHAEFIDAARKVSASRHRAAKRLALEITAELPPLKLDKARFRVAISTDDVDQATATGLDRVVFEVATNPGQPFGSLAKIASGGELSRLMLALKVVLARLDATPTLIFDEVDSGVGGSTAAAVGARLERLGEDRQVLVVTHAPQIAARARQHLTVVKSADGELTEVAVRPLDGVARRDEIARMLAGAKVTKEARAAAQSLIDGETAIARSSTKLEVARAG